MLGRGGTVSGSSLQLGVQGLESRSLLAGEMKFVTSPAPSVQLDSTLRRQTWALHRKRRDVCHRQNDVVRAE
jgi:hypothetical protein